MADAAGQHRGASARAATDLAALAAVTDAIEAGAGLPEILRAAARALDASLDADRPLLVGAGGGRPIPGR